LQRETLRLKNGLFVFSYLYRVDSLGDDDEDQVEYESSQIPQNEDIIIPFQPRGLRNLSVVDEMDSLSPLTNSKVINLTDEDSPQIFTLCGRGARSSLRMLRHGIEANEVAVSELPGNPNAVWTVKLASAGKLIVFDCFFLTLIFLIVNL
jgi:splicing factor 3B subunit 3